MSSLSTSTCKSGAINPSSELYLDLLKRCLTASIYEESAWKVIPRDRIVALMHPPSRWDLLQLAKDRLQRLLIQSLQKRSLMLVRRNTFNPGKREQGADWPCFGYTMTGHRRLNILENCIRDVLDKKVPGDLIETGAWRGGTTIFMRAVLRAYAVSDRVVWVADSFQGMPRPQTSGDGWDLSAVEYLHVSLEQVKSNFAKFGLLDDQVQFLVGWFKDTLPSAPIEKLSILRLDGDLYHSTKDALANLYFKVSRGGYVIVDDYYSWEGCHRAVTEFLSENHIRAAIQPIDSQSAYWKVTD